MGLQTEIWAWRLGGGGDEKEEERGEVGGENSPYVRKHRSSTPSGPLAKNGKCFVISDFILPDDDELIRRPFAY